MKPMEHLYVAAWTGQTGMIFFTFAHKKKKISVILIISIGILMTHSHCASTTNIAIYSLNSYNILTFEWFYVILVFNSIHEYDIFNQNLCIKWKAEFKIILFMSLLHSHQ